MIFDRKLQFAITREDADIEASLIQASCAKEVLLVCSGGDTILALKSRFPELKITAFDFNPVQIEHFKSKATAPKNVLNSEICRNGNFESLFRQWGRFFNEFIVSERDTLEIFQSEGAFPAEIFTSPYWAVSFDLHFHDSILRAMFGDAAVQHAPKGSYPRYFQRMFERGLKRKNFQDNQFLQHIFLGRYLRPPFYLEERPDISDVSLVHGTLKDVPEIHRFDLIQLSNIFDWSGLEEIKDTCDYLAAHMRPGSRLLLRQINNESPIEELLGPSFKFDSELGKKFVDEDKSLFYSKIIVAEKKV